jgi:transposase
MDALFIFSNKKKDKLKILYWDKTGFAMWYKRLEKQRFKWPSDDQLSRLILSEQQLNWLLGGYDVIGHKPLQYSLVFCLLLQMRLFADIAFACVKYVAGNKNIFYLLAAAHRNR